MVRGTAERPDESDHNRAIAAHRAAILPFVAAGGLALSMAVLVGWWADIAALKTGLTGFTAMKANTAFGFSLSFAAVWLLSAENVAPWRLTTARLLAVIVLLLGAATVGEYLTASDFGIDQLLVRDRGDIVQSRAPGRMGANSAINFVLAGATLLLARANSRRAALLSQLCAGTALALTFSVLLGYAFGAWALTNIALFTPMALHTAAAFTALTLSLLALTADKEIIAELLSDRFGGALAKLLLPVIVIGIPLVGWIRLQAERKGYFGLEVGLALYALFNVLMLSVIVVLVARWLNRADSAQQVALTDLRESDTRFRRLADNVPGIVYQRIVEPGGRSRLAFISSGVQVLYGPDCTPEKALADPDFLRRQFHPDDRERIDGLRREAYRTLSRFEFEARIVRSDGAVRWIHNLSQPRKQTGAAVIWDGLIVDITARKEAEAAKDDLQQRLRQAQKMEAVGQLTGGIAHDFNNLLTIALGNAEMLAERLGIDPAADRKTIDMIRRAGERGAALTQRLLAFSRQQVLLPTQLDLNIIVRDLDELLRRALGESIEIVTKCAADLWPALADKSQVEEALLNLAVNARDAMADGGKLTIETANVWLDEAYAAVNPELNPGPYAMLAISDTGTGMSREVIERAFEPFFTTKGVGKGTGLGLSMIFGFAKQSGGHVKIYSEVGHGTTVKLYLPRGESHAQSHAADDARRHAHAASGRRILLVEDEGDVRTMVTTMLVRLGYEVVAAADGPAALIELDKLGHVDLLFTDVVLPRGMSGRHLAEEAMRRRPGLRVLYTSGYTQDSIIHHGRLDEGVELIGKPYRAADLARKIAAMLAPVVKTVSRP
jgi:signal transduction histidine kinase